MDNHQAVIGGHLPRFKSPVIVQQPAKIGIPVPGGFQVVNLFYRGQTLLVRFKLLLKFGIHKQQLRLAVIEVKEHLLGRQPPVDRQHNCTEGGRSTVKHEVFQAVFADDADARALGNAGALQARRQPVDPVLELRKSYHPTVINLKPGRLLLETCGIPADQVIEGKIVQAHRMLPRLVNSRQLSLPALF